MQEMSLLRQSAPCTVRSATFFKQRGKYGRPFSSRRNRPYKAIDNFNTDLDVRFPPTPLPMCIGEIRRYLRDDNSIRGQPFYERYCLLKQCRLRNSL